MLTAGQWPFRRVNGMCDDLHSFTLISISLAIIYVKYIQVKWVHYQRFVARPEVTDGGTASNVEGSWEYIE